MEFCYTIITYFHAIMLIVHAINVKQYINWKTINTALRLLHKYENKKDIITI